MLAEERFHQILKIVEQKNAVTVQELTELLNASESTIRRDLTILHERGSLIKVFGGATAIGASYNTKDDTVEKRLDQNRDEKIAVAKFAASLIKPNDFVYLDAGTTTDIMIDYIIGPDVLFVTDGLLHARKLAQKGYTTILLGGELKPDTDAVIGGETVQSLEKYNFTKGFFGTNGIHIKNGFSTPDIHEALVKEKAFSRCREKYIVSDSSKFNIISSVTFGKFDEATIITTKLSDTRYQKYPNIKEVDFI